MASVIHFPKTRSLNPILYVLDRFEALQEDKPVDTCIFSEGDDAAFLDLLREWPCFYPIDSKLSLEEILELYYEDELTLAQDCVIEFLFHMHDPDSTFDISNALYTWEEEDRHYFLVNVNMHAELITRMKHEEL